MSSSQGGKDREELPDDALVWQGYGGTKYHREGCQMLNRSGAVSWQKAVAKAGYDDGLGLEPCKVCRP